MKGIESDGGTIDAGALWQALAELEAGDLESKQREELMELIGRSPAAQRGYLDYFQMSSMLEGEARTRAERGRMPVVVGQRRLANRVFRRSILAAAAILMVFALGAALIIVRQDETEYLAASATADARWSIDGSLQNPDEAGPKVAEGSSVHVGSGMVRLKTGSGASLVLQGPAHVSFPEVARPVLHEGWLWVDSEDAQESFEVVTPELLVRDVGTRFAVRVEDGEAAEVHLLDGRVEVLSKASKEVLATLDPEERGFLISASGESEVLTIARDPFPELADLLMAPANYSTTVRSQHPKGYWRTDQSKPGFLDNVITGGLAGRFHPKAVMAGSGPDAAGGFGGFGDGNQSVSLVEGRKPSIISLGAPPVHDGIMYRDDFGGSNDDLHGTSPDVTFSGARWVASPIFRQDGSVGHETGSATLAFAPVDGVVYTLDATVTAASAPSEDWIGLGFLRGQSVSSARIQTKGILGRAWMLHRAADTTKPVNRIWMSANASDWIWPDGSPLGGTMDMRIVLDTTGGAGSWTATWFAKRPEESDYRMVGETEKLINESITSVGLSVIGKRLSASVEAFSLRADQRSQSRAERHLAAGPATVERKEGALSLWIRRESGMAGDEVLWSAGENRLDESIRAHLTADGRVGFFMENGRYDIMIASEESVNDGEWHHLVFSWNPSAVEIHVDGRLAASDTGFRGLQQGILNDLRIGRAREDAGGGFFRGGIDEIALWDRALTPVEVAQQYGSAKGKP